MSLSKFSVAVAGFVFGVFVRSLFYFHYSYAIFLLAMSAVVLAYLWFFASKEENISKTKTFLASIFILAFSLGALRFAATDTSANPLIDRFVGQKITAEGIISDEPSIGENSSLLTVRVAKISGEVADVKILVVAGRYSGFQYGDKISFTGKLSQPENFAESNPPAQASGQNFDYVDYLAERGIYYESFLPKISLVSGGKGNFIYSALYGLKSAFIGKIGELIPEPRSSLLGGLLLGAKKTMGSSLLDEFRRTGVIHIVVLSGYNVTIIGNAIMKFFSFLPGIFATSFGILSVIFFVIMTGASAATVRASTMAMLAVLAKTIGRKYSVTRALCIVGVAMILQNPKILVFDSGFQLSFISIIGLIYATPIFEERFKFLPEKFKLKSIAVSTITAQIFVLPFLIYKMGNFSLVGLPANLLILGFVPATMFFGFMTGILAFSGHILAFPFALVSNFLLWYILTVVHLFSSLPFASVGVSYFPVWLMISIYILYAAVLIKFHNKKSPGSPQASR